MTWWHRFSAPTGQLELLGQRQWVHKRFHAEIAAADADAGFTYPPQ
jgi:hypothetical protein